MEEIDKNDEESKKRARNEQEGRKTRASGIARMSKEIISNNPQKRDEDDDDASDSVPIPTDLIIEILARLPPKHLAKFVDVSEVWSSTIRGKYFTDLFLNRSLARPCFLFTFYRDGHRIFLSVPRDAPSSGSSITTPYLGPVISPPVRGLICCQIASKVAISNPSTGQSVSLPKVRTRRTKISSFFGYDPVEDEYKVLSMTVLQHGYKYGSIVSGEHQVFTLGEVPKASWRMITCTIPHCPATKGICIDGVVYYAAWSNSSRKQPLIVAFDVRLEEFSAVKLPDPVEGKTYIQSDTQLVKHEGKMALLNHLYLNSGQFELWVLEDKDRQEWSKIVVVVPSWWDFAGHNFLTCRGAISSGEFIFAPPHSKPQPFFILSYDRKEDHPTRVEIEGIVRPFDSMKVFLDYAECPVLL